MKFIPDHQQLIVRGFVETPIRSAEDLNKWLTELVHLVDMEVVAGPTSVYVPDEGNEGVTGTVTLATSHAAIHIWDNISPALVQFDIYSCKEFEPSVVLNHLNKMELVEYECMRLDRNDSILVIRN